MGLGGWGEGFIHNLIPTQRLSCCWTYTGLIDVITTARILGHPVDIFMYFKQVITPWSILLSIISFWGYCSISVFLCCESVTGFALVAKFPPPDGNKSTLPNQWGASQREKLKTIITQVKHEPLVNEKGAPRSISNNNIVRNFSNL